jgi:hypothetical protein
MMIDGNNLRRTKFLSAKGLGVWVKTEKNGLVNQWIFLLRPWAFLDFLASRSDDGLDFIAVDQSGDVGVGDLRRRKTKDIVNMLFSWIKP